MPAKCSRHWKVFPAIDTYRPMRWHWCTPGSTSATPCSNGSTRRTTRGTFTSSSCRSIPSGIGTDPIRDSRLSSRVAGSPPGRERIRKLRRGKGERRGDGRQAGVGLVNGFVVPEDVVVCAAGSLPGDLHRYWRARRPNTYHLEYGYSCMGYEIAGGLGVALADPAREVYVLVGDGSYLMMAQEIVTSLQEKVKLNIVLL